MKALLITASGLLVLVCVACSLKYLQDESAWQKEQDALTRLQSGMKYEPILMLRSQLADADAGVEEYASKWRAFPRDHGGMVQAAKRGILYVSNALDWDDKANSQDAPDTDRADALALAAYADVTTSLPRSCFNGQIAFSPKIVAVDFALYGEYWLELAQGKYERQPIGS